MCEPTTLAVAAIAATAASTYVSIQGQQQAGHAAKAQADYQAGVARNNAILAQRAATDARQRGDVAADQSAQRTQALIGKQRAILAQNGVDVNSGSALDITTDTAGAGKLDELTLRSNAERAALGYEAQGSNFNAAAGLDELTGANALSAANTASLGTALSGAGTVASKWYDFSKKGAFTAP
jgi:hypothetical protein